MLVDCMFSQSYRSLIESQNCWLDNSNQNSVIGSTINQFETPVRVDIFTRSFSLSFISIVNLSMTFLYFSPMTSLSQFWVFLDYLLLYRTVNFFNQRYTNTDLKISLSVLTHVKTISWKFCILNSKNAPVILP